jgi:putative tricarboxylic transport membrane protein
MRSQRLAAAVLLAFGLAGALEAGRLAIGDPAHPGPGFFPFWLALLLCLVAVALFLRASPAPVAPGPAAPAPAARGKAVMALATSVVYAFALEPLGFLLTTLLFLVVLLRAVERRSWLSTVTVAAATAVASHVVFKVWLDIQLPAGPWGF